MSKSMKKTPVRVKRNYEFSQKAIVILDKIKAMPDIKLNDFVSEAVVHYAKYLAENGGIEGIAAAEAEGMEKRLRDLERHVYSMHYEHLKERMGEKGVQEAQDYLLSKGLIETSSFEGVRKEIKRKLGDNSPRTPSECRVLIHMAPKTRKAANG